MRNSLGKAVSGHGEVLGASTPNATVPKTVSGSSPKGQGKAVYIKIFSQRWLLKAPSCRG